MVGDKMLGENQILGLTIGILFAILFYVSRFIVNHIKMQIWRKTNTNLYKRHHMKSEIYLIASTKEMQLWRSSLSTSLLDSTSSFTATHKIPITSPTQEMNQWLAYSRTQVITISIFQYHLHTIAEIFNHKILIQQNISIKIPST